MKIGSPKETKTHEFRVGLTPNSVQQLTQLGHQVFIESTAGLGIGFTDENYQTAGAVIVENPIMLYNSAELIIKVKEPSLEEASLLKAQHTLFTYLHLAANKPLTKKLLKSQACCIAYETVTSQTHALPLLTPMSEIAGRLSIQAGAHCLEKINGGKGMLLSGVAGVLAAKVVIIGGGIVGQNAIKIAIGMGANVTLLDTNIATLRQIDHQYGSAISTIYSTEQSIHDCCIQADLVVGAVLIPGAKAPKLVKKETIKLMKTGSAIVDVAIDQGGCFETSLPTTHQTPTFVELGVVHYCVSNMPGIVAHTSTHALNNATLPYIIELANAGIKQTLLSNQHILNGLNIIHGNLTHKNIGESLNLTYTDSLNAVKA